MTIFGLSVFISTVGAEIVFFDMIFLALHDVHFDETPCRTIIIFLTIPSVYNPSDFGLHLPLIQKNLTTPSH